MSENDLLCICGKQCATLAGYKSHKRACKAEEPKAFYRAIVEETIRKELAEFDPVAIEETSIAVGDYKHGLVVFNRIKREFPWNDKDELLAELIDEPGFYRDLYLATKGLRHELFDKKAPGTDMLGKPHDNDEAVKLYTLLDGHRDHPEAGKLLKAVDAAWEAAFDGRSSRMAEAFKGNKDVLERIVKNESWYRKDSKSHAS